MTAHHQERWQHSASEAEAYELHKVPRMFGPMATLLLDGLSLASAKRILDVACGTGIVARSAGARLGPSATVVGLDRNESMLAVARETATDAGAPIEWRQGDAAELPFADASFDVVLCQQGLQFFPDQPRALREMRRVLADGGVAGLAVFGAPTKYNIALADALARYADAATAQRSLAPYSLADRGVLLGLLRDAGFNEIDVRIAAITRRFAPTQEWLLQEIAAMPYSAAVVRMAASARAAMLRELAAQLKEFWAGDCFAIPNDVHFVYARR